MAKQSHRRKFMKKFALGVGAWTCGWQGCSEDKKVDASRKGPTEVEARYYEKLPADRVWCHLCPKECDVGPGERGTCGVRENREGTYYSLVYGNPCACHIDPIEKKPFFHVFPNTQAFSLATAGCNMDCKYCQNWQISQATPEETHNLYLPPHQVAEEAAKRRCRSVAYTYSEPTIFFEYMVDTAKAAQKKGIKNVVVSNGFIMPDPLKELCQHVDAIKVDFKGFSESFYVDVCDGHLQPVLDTLKRIKEAQVWLEIVCLLVPTMNDSKEEIQKLCEWVASNLGKETPLHFSRFHPCYKLSGLYATPPKTVEMAWQTGKEAGLHFVYTGNLPRHEGAHTFCPQCGEKIIERYGYVVLENRLKEGRCGFCGGSIPGLW